MLLYAGPVQVGILMYVVIQLIDVQNVKLFVTRYMSGAPSVGRFNWYVLNLNGAGSVWPSC